VITDFYPKNEGLKRSLIAPKGLAHSIPELALFIYQQRLKQYNTLATRTLIILKGFWR